jgi:hypothetical protein
MVNAGDCAADAALYVQPFPFLSFKDELTMPPKTANWITAAGALLMFVGLCTLPAGLGEHPDADLRNLGVCLFSLGALVIATGMYAKARLVQATIDSTQGKKEAPTNQRVRGGCDLCGSEVPVVQCQAHQLHLCGTCLAQHYDVRSCSYRPTTRVLPPKASRNSAKKARAGT